MINMLSYKRKLWKIMKMSQLIPSLCLCPGSLASHVLEATLFLSYGDCNSEPQNVSTQITKFPLVDHYHASPMLQNPHDLCGASQANTHLAATSFSLELRQDA